MGLIFGLFLELKVKKIFTIVMRITRNFILPPEKVWIRMQDRLRQDLQGHAQQI